MLKEIKCLARAVFFRWLLLTSRVIPQDVRTQLCSALILNIWESLLLFFKVSANVSSHTPRRPHPPLF